MNWGRIVRDYILEENIILMRVKERILIIKENFGMVVVILFKLLVVIWEEYELKKFFYCGFVIFFDNFDF